jgi:two-component system sensor histidine kinase RegB
VSLGGEQGRYLATSWRPVRLGTLVGLRWLAIAGQTIGVLFVHFGLGYPLPLIACLALIALSVAFNLWLIVRFGPGYRPNVAFAAAQLIYDSAQLGGLLALTGGLENPFALLLFAPISVSATTLPQRWTVLLAVFVIVIASILAVVHLPLPWDPKARLVFDSLYVVGIWGSLVCGVVFISAYTNRVAHEARQLADALTATELALSRREQLHALDGLAAAAAHELGTPLSTIALAAKEMLGDIPAGPLREDVELIISQSARCRAILAKLRNLGADGGDPFAAVPLQALIAEVAKPHEGKAKTITIHGEGGGPEPVIGRSAGLLYGLGNLIENAASFARSTVTIAMSWDKSTVRLNITDDGRGFPPELIARLGEPYLTTRLRNDATQPGGLGLGIFIAKTLLERTGATLTFGNAATDGSRARVNIVWPRTALEAASVHKL